MKDAQLKFDLVPDTIISDESRKAQTKPRNSQIVKNIDCRDGLENLNDQSISMVLTDPPYFIDGMGSDWDKNRLEKRISKGAVVQGLPVGMRFSKNQCNELYSFMLPIAQQWMRVVKSGGFVLCFMQPRLSHAVGWAMQEAGIEIRDMFTWVRNGQAKAFSQAHFINKRNISETEKQKLLKKVGNRKTPQLRPMGETIILGQIPRDGTFVDNFIKHGVGLIDTSNPVLEPDKFPSTLMSAEKPVSADRHGHITPKPVNLLRHLIRIFGGKNPVILDTFAGCGSAGEACVREGADFLGFEINPIYAREANSRIREVQHEINNKTNKKRI